MARKSPDRSVETEEPSRLKLPREYTAGDFVLDERVVMFARMTHSQVSLKRGTVVRINGNRVTAKLDYPPRTKVVNGNNTEGVCSAAVNSPLLMKESVFDRLYRNHAEAREWVHGGDVDPRSRASLLSHLTRLGVTEGVSTAPAEARTDY